MKHESFEIDVVFCSNCEALRNPGEFEYLGHVVELGNIPSFRCNMCGAVFEMIIDVMPDLMPGTSSASQSDSHDGAGSVG